jgi:cytochrome c peroxidase
LSKAAGDDDGSEGAMPHMTRLSAITAIAATLAIRLPAQAQEKVTRLGELLFSSTALSKANGTSCATCHDPKKSFADARPEAKGDMQIEIGRNTPTLFGIGTIAAFRDPRQAQDAKPGKAPRVLNLEERCLAPIENELEMGSRVEDSIAALRRQPEWAKRFDEAFGDQEGATKPRLAKALAAFVRSLERPASARGKAPYAEFLAGNQAALDAEQTAGLAAFKQRGCGECHAGPALSDGLMHVVDPPWGQRMRDRQRTASARHVELLRREYAKKKTVADVTAMTQEALVKEAKLRANALPGGGGYDADQIEVQTTTLWDVRNTAPYFRDGSVSSLEEAVKVHVKEMRTVDENEARVRKELVEVDHAGKRSPAALRPAPKRAPNASQGASELAEPELRQILKFLDALSPPGTAR